MKYIVIGLGSFGFTLAKQLTTMGHEVIGVDEEQHKVEEHKDEITDTICLNSTEEHALKVLPLKDADIVIVAIGKDVSASILTTAILKKMEVKKLFVRAISSLHKTVLQSLKVDRIMQPEQESAAHFAASLDFSSFSENFIITDDYTVFETKIPKTFISQPISIADFEKNFQLQLIAVKKLQKATKILNSLKYTLLYNPSKETILEETDKLILIGGLAGFQKFSLIFD